MDLNDGGNVQSISFRCCVRHNWWALANSLGGPAGNGRFLDNDLGAGRDLGNSSGSQLDKVQVSGETSTETRLLGRSVDRDEDQVGLGDTLVNLGGEEQVPASASLDDINETGLVDGQVEFGVVPSVDTGLVEVDNGDLDVRTLESATQGNQEEQAV